MSHAEKALGWKKDEGFRHFDVDDGSRPGRYPGGLLLNQDRKINARKVVALAQKRPSELPSFIKQFIIPVPRIMLYNLCDYSPQDTVAVDERPYGAKSISRNFLYRPRYRQLDY